MMWIAGGGHAKTQGRVNDGFGGSGCFFSGGHCLVLLCYMNVKIVIPAGKRVSSAMDGKLKSIHGVWIPAIHAGMTILENTDHIV
jgi:hypothetical protein